MSCYFNAFFCGTQQAPRKSFWPDRKKLAITVNGGNPGAILMPVYPAREESVLWRGEFAFRSKQRARMKNRAD